MIGPIPALTVDLTFMVAVLRVHGHGERAAAAFSTVRAIRGHAEPDRPDDLRNGGRRRSRQPIAAAVNG
jgi:hypothetical protein